MKTETKWMVMTMVFALVLSFTGLKSAYAVPMLDPMDVGMRKDSCSLEYCDACKTGDECSTAGCYWTKTSLCVGGPKTTAPIDDIAIAAEAPAMEAPAAAEVVAADEGIVAAMDESIADTVTEDTAEDPIEDIGDIDMDDGTVDGCVPDECSKQSAGDCKSPCRLRYGGCKC